MNLARLAIPVVYLALTTQADAACKAGSFARCAINGQQGTMECLDNGKFTPCEPGAKGGTGPVLTGPITPNPYVGDANDTRTILADADIFYSAYFGMSDDEEVAYINKSFAETWKGSSPPYWEYGRRTSALVQIYDLLAPLDPARAGKYLERLRRIASALLANRDDYLKIPPHNSHPVDFFRKRTMPAWGAYTEDRDGRWNTDPVTAGLFTYAMAAFARRVADSAVLSAKYGADAIRFTTAALETYGAFLPEQHLTPQDPYAYFTVPLGYRLLACKNSHACENYRAVAGRPISYNENLSMMKALAEIALASDSRLYRASADGRSPMRLFLGTDQAPLLIAKNFTYFDRHLSPKKLSDGTPIFEWNHQEPLPRIQDTAHASFELGSLAVLLDEKIRLNALLANHRHTEQVALSTPLFVRFANTFLRKIWHYDYSDQQALHNVLSENVDGSGYLGTDQGKSANWECAGWIPLAQFDRWIWIRCRDATFHDPGFLREDNHAALLRYRQFL